jgi:hypothetical protein
MVMADGQPRVAANLALSAFTTLYECLGGGVVPAGTPRTV